MYAYVTIGPKKGDKLELMCIEVEGPGEQSQEGFAQKLDGLETIWVPAKITAASLNECKEKRLVHPGAGPYLMLSLRSLTFDAHLRFIIHRTFLGEKTGWAVAPPPNEYGGSCFEMLAASKDPVTWVKDKAPTEVSAADYGDSLRCLSFIKNEEMCLVVAHPKEGGRSFYARPFDSLSQALSSAEPLRTMAVSVLAATAYDNRDWKVYADYGFQKVIGAKEHRTKPKGPGTKEISYMLGQPDLSYQWQRPQFLRSLLHPLYPDFAPGT